METTNLEERFSENPRIPQIRTCAGLCQCVNVDDELRCSCHCVSGVAQTDATMAEGGAVADFLICSLCLNDFSDPRALPCLHTFCLKCLKDLHKSERNKSGDESTRLRCPMCQEDHEIPKEGLGSFRQDFRIKNFLEICNSNNKCELQLTMCTKHPDKQLMFVCRTCGQAELCIECRNGIHMEHYMINVLEKHEELLNKIKNAKVTIRRNCKILTSIRDRLQKNKVEMKEKVAARVQAYRALLSCLEMELCRDIDKKTNEQISVLDQHKNTLLQALSNIELREADMNNTFHEFLTKMPVLDLNIQFLQSTFCDQWSAKFEIPCIETSRAMDARKFKRFDDTLAGVRIEEVRTDGPKYSHKNIQKCNMRAEQISYWKHGCNSIRGMVSHNIGGEGLTILSSSQIRVYEQATGNLFHYEEHNDNIGEIAIFGWRNHAIVNRGANEVMTYGYWPLNLRQPERVIKVRGTASWSISGTQNYLVYGSKLDEKVCIVCFSMESHRPKFKWSQSIPGWSQERSVNAMELGPNQLVVLVANSCSGGLPTRQHDALVAIDGYDQLWTVSYRALDTTTERFDLIDMSNDGRYFYVLNARAGSIYLISMDGEVLCKLLQNLIMPVRFCVNKKTKTLTLARKGTEITVYSLEYE